MIEYKWVIIVNTDFLITEISRVIMVDKDEYAEKTTNFGTCLAKNELIFHFSGEATVYFNNKIMKTQKNTIRFLPKGENSNYVVERKSHGECILICFDTDTPVSAEAFTLDVKNAVAIGNLFKKIFAVWVAKHDGFYFECISILYKIFSELQKDNYIPKNQYEKIEPAISYIENHFLDAKISVELLAGLCNISVSYLKKLFVKKFGVPPIKYIIRLKINYACDLLRTDLYKVTQIAEMCGFNNIHFFSRQFREYTSLTPTEFKNKYKSSK